MGEFMKNPYTFVNKANSTFNLYLEKFSEFEKFMEESQKEQEKTNRLLLEFKKEYQDYQNNINSILVELSGMSESIIKEVMKNNVELENINDINEFNQEKIINLIKKNEKNSNKLLVSSNNKIENSIENSTSDLIYNITGSDSSLRGHVDGAVGGLDSSLRGHVDGAVGGLDSSIRSINKQNDELYLLSNKLISTINNFVENQETHNNKSNKAINLFNSLYDDCKKYYLNNQVEELSKYLRTGELFRLGFFNDIQYISFSPAENKILLKSPEGILFFTNNRFYTLKEVIAFNGYSIPQLYQFDDFIVFDIGMNRAYASLWFANFENCSHVYGFEIDDSTYNMAVENIGLNTHLSNKITPYNIGFSDTDEIVDLYYISGCDGVNTMISEFTNIQVELKENKDKICTKQVEVKKSSEIISKIIEDNNISSKIVLKIDTEGAEYKIVDDLIQSGIINKIDVILGEGHIFSEKNIVEDLLSLGFKQIKYNEQSFTYDFAFVKDEYHDIWPLKE